MSKTSFLELAKKLNIPHRNCMKTREELEEAIRETITNCKEIIFGSDTTTCTAFLDELQKKQIIDQKIFNQRLMEETKRKVVWEERLQKNIVMDGDTMIDKRA